MKKLIILLITVVSISEQTIVLKYKSAPFDQIQSVGKQVGKIVNESKFETDEERRYLFNYANGFYHQLTGAISLLNKAFYTERLVGANQKELGNMINEFSLLSAGIQQSILDYSTIKIKNQLANAIEQITNKVDSLSHVALEADKTEGAKIVENLVDRASHKILRGFYQIITLQSNLGKTKEQILEGIKLTGTAAVLAINDVTGDKKNIAQTLKNPAGNLEDLLHRVVVSIDNLLFDEENIPNAKDIRELSNKLWELHDKAVSFKLKFAYEDDGEKLKVELKALSEKVESLFKELTKHIIGVSGLEIVEEILPQAETGAKYLLYYLNFAKV